MRVLPCTLCALTALLSAAVLTVSGQNQAQVRELDFFTLDEFEFNQIYQLTMSKLYQTENTIFEFSGAGATGPAALHAAAEPGAVATAQVQPRCDLATAADATPTTENIKSVANFQVEKESDRDHDQIALCIQELTVKFRKTFFGKTAS